jgi:DNA-binding NtrC family response regulator
MALGVAAQYGRDIDVLLTDVIMPQMPGTQLAVSLKRSRPEVKIVLMSGGPIANAGDQGCEWPLLLKPFRIGDVIGTLHEVLHGQSERTMPASA